MTSPPPYLSPLWSIPAPETKVVWKEGPVLLCHSTLFQCLVLITASQKSHYKILDLLFNLVVTILQCCNLQQTCKPWTNSKVSNLLWNIITTQHKKYNKKASDAKKKRTEKWFTLEQPNHPTLHILGKELGAKLRLHFWSHCPYPTKSVWIWPPFHNFVQKKVPVKQPSQTHYFQNWCNKVLLFSWKTDLQSHYFQMYNSNSSLLPTYHS